MARVSRVQAAANRVAMVDAAAVLVRERGVTGVTVDAVCARVGLTPGGFYKQFASRDALLTEALDHVVDQRRVLMEALGEPGSFTAREALAAAYLSEGHRDDAGHGCLVAALAGTAESALSSDHFAQLHRALADLINTATGPDENAGTALVAVSVMVGAVQLARMTRGSDISAEILTAAKAHFQGRN